MPATRDATGSRSLPPGPADGRESSSPAVGWRPSTRDSGPALTWASIATARRCWSGLVQSVMPKVAIPRAELPEPAVRSGDSLRIAAALDLEQTIGVALLRHPRRGRRGDCRMGVGDDAAPRVITLDLVALRPQRASDRKARGRVDLFCRLVEDLLGDVILALFRERLDDVLDVVAVLLLHLGRDRGAVIALGSRRLRISCPELNRLRSMSSQREFWA